MAGSPIVAYARSLFFPILRTVPVMWLHNVADVASSHLPSKFFQLFSAHEEERLISCPIILPKMVAGSLVESETVKLVTGHARGSSWRLATRLAAIAA